MGLAAAEHKFGHARRKSNVFWQRELRKSAKIFCGEQKFVTNRIKKPTQKKVFGKSWQIRLMGEQPTENIKENF